jgi:alpha-galactosidase
VLAARDDSFALAWQLEHNGRWRWDLAEESAGLTLTLSGPTDADHQWLAVLRPGETFCTVPATVALGVGWQAALGELTKHRRLARRPHPDNERLTVIYNDYMNTLMGDATTKRLLSLVDAAAEASADAFCIDAGRYDTTMQGFAGWWDYVGEWQPSIVRFPNGITEVFDRIRERGLVPGLWLEPEVVGVRILVCLPSEPTKVGTGLGIAAGQVAQAGFWMSVSAIHPLRMNIKVMLDFSCCRCALWSVGAIAWE